MNKIFHKNIDKVRRAYVSFVEPIIRERLNIVIGIIGVEKGLITHKELNSDTFKLNGNTYNIGKDPYQKKEFSNLFLDNERHVGIKDGIINFVGMTKLANYKKNIRTAFPDLTVYLLLSKNLRRILNSKLDALKTLTINLKNANGNMSPEEKSILEAIFIYPEFFQKPNGPWYYGLKLAQELQVEICPYCNRNDIKSTFDVNGTKLTGPTIDHFLGQADYPFLALTFYNLIPSCYDCNSKLKHDKPFDLIHFLYPYEDSYETSAIFNIFQRGSMVNNKLVDENDLEIMILDLIDDTKPAYLKLHGPLPKGSDKKKGSLNVFQTQAIYNQKNLRNAILLIDKHRKFPKSHVDSIFQSMLKDQGLSKEQAYLTYYESYLLEQSFNKMPLSRFKRDLNRQLNKIYGYDHV